jgi:imidazolonepropionase-like amidohydrolase
MAKHASSRPAWCTFSFALIACCGTPVAAETFAFTGATIMPVSHPPVENGVLVIRDGEIVAVGAADDVRIPRGATVVEVADATIVPGLVDTHSHIGEVAGADRAAPIQPEARALDAINVRDSGFERARAGGITTANLMSGSGHLMSGQTIYVRLREGNSIEELAYRDEAGGIAGGMKMANGTNSRDEPPFPGTRAKSAALVRQKYVAAQEYREKLLRARAGDGEMPDRDLAMEALVEVLDGRRTVHHHTHRHDDVLTVLRLRQEFGFRVVLHHVSEAYRVADEIAAADVPASIIIVDSPGGKLEARNLNLENPLAMERAGVDVAFHTDDYITDSRFFLRMAALGVRSGMSPDKALEALTLAGARMLGLDEGVGSLEPGKEADFVILSGDPFSVYTRVLETWVEGTKVFDLDNPEDREVAEGGYGVLTPAALAHGFHGYGEGHR